ncbi:MAG TPA: hypothetical protein VFA41_23125 [Ktedonobacteraceae bacterium]|nr:hypothetical protein [Ktedonobacteraceae bacterium]
MYARVTILEWKTGQKHEGMDELIRLMRESVVPASKQQPGFKGFLGLLDRREGKGMAITLWETEADLHASEASGYYRAQLTKAEPVFGLSASAPYREMYEVVIQELPE